MDFIAERREVTFIFTSLLMYHSHLYQTINLTLGEQDMLWTCSDAQWEW
jgi:hypothetical protein